MLKNLVYFVILGCFITVFSNQAEAQTSIKGQWVLVSMTVEGDMAIPFTQGSITLNVKDRSLGGNGGCNTYGGDYLIKGKRLKIKNVISTQMACDNLENENRYFKALNKSTRFTSKEGELILKDEQGQNILRFKKVKK